MDNLSDEDLCCLYSSCGALEYRDELLFRNLSLVRDISFVIHRGVYGSFDYCDIEGYGVLGLFDSIDRFVKLGGDNFRNYAFVRVRGFIYDELRRLDFVPRSVRDRVRNFRIFRDSFEDDLCAVASVGELSAGFGISFDELSLLLLDEVKSGMFVSLDSYLFDDFGDAVLRKDCLVASSSLDPWLMYVKNEFAIRFSELVNSFSSLERGIIFLYYYEGLGLRELGDLFGMSASMVCRIKQRLLRILRNNLSDLFE